MTDSPHDAGAASPPVFQLGLDRLLADGPDWVAGRRWGVVSHAAAVDAAGVTTATRLHATPAVTVVALFGPEHGFAGTAGAGELTADGLHPAWRIPIYSLYGATRQPTPAMLQGLDGLIVDFQTLAARPYTYVATLRAVLAAAAAAALPVIVCDRPVPLPDCVEGPLVEPAFASFVAAVPAPLQYGLTLGETALWLRARFWPQLDVRVAAMTGYRRDPHPQPGWPAWVPPSPRIHSWTTACCYTATVAGEALPALDYGSGTPDAFQVIGAPWLDPAALRDDLDAAQLPGLQFVPCRYRAGSGLYANTELAGLRLVPVAPSRLRPALTAVTLLQCLQTRYGRDSLWNAPGTRPGFFDQLFGADRVRLALWSATPADAIARTWEPDAERFLTERQQHLLYPSHPAPAA
jgi:uncharacterized protein YbbC (DUF1343 family)